MDKESYFEKVHGAWLGRVAGSHFGMPLEFRPYRFIQKKYCNKGRSELSGYVKQVDPTLVNDDEMYEIVGLLALEEKDLEITSEDIAEKWDKFLDKNLYTAERVALKNIRNGIMPPDSSSPRYQNYWYDAIGGQMKGDIWGLLAPNNPELASKLACIDGEVAHQGIGIDGEVFISTLIANAFSSNDIEQLIQSSLKYLDSESSYLQFVETAIEIYHKYADWKEGRKILLEKWHTLRKKLKKESDSWKRRVIFLSILPFVHVLPNAGIITLSLLYGSNDTQDTFGRPICLAGMMAYDTDCNCGNIGTIMGTIHGSSRIPDEWKKPLKNTFNTYIKNYESWKISELAQKIVDIGLQLHDSA